MNDIKTYLPKSRKLFRLFLDAHLKNYWDEMNFARVGPGTGYWYYYRDGEVIQHIRNIVHNLDQTFGNLTIPTEFASPSRLIDTWSNFMQLLIQKNELFDDVIKTSKIKNQSLPDPFWSVHKVHIDTLALLEEIMNMDEVKVLLEPKDLGVVYDNKNEHGKYDIVVITAIYDTEFEALKTLPIPQESVIFINDSTNYRKCKIGNKSVLFATDDKMGMTASAALTTKIIAKFSPIYIIMAGIAAGVKDNEKNYGDILVARTTWNYDSGKFKFDKTNEVTIFEPNPEQVELENSIIHHINELKSDKKLLDEIKNSYKTTSLNKQPKTKLKLFLGPMASGSAVVADEKKIASIRRKNRKLIGIDMETFGVYYSTKSYSTDNKTKSISIKSISDFADQTKCDNYRDFAAHTSAYFIYKLILLKLQ
jgi:nucleoside phosphorylase